MTQQLSAAQQAQQTNRTSDGKYTTKTHSEAEVDLGMAQDHDIIDLEDGDSHEIDGLNAMNNDVFDRAEIINSDDYAVVGTIDETFRHCLPEDIAKYEDHYDDADVNAYLHDRSHIIEDFVKERYGDNIDLDPGPDDTFAFEFSKDLDGPVSEEDAVEALWEDTSAVDFKNEMDPGTFGTEDASAMLRKRLEAHDMTKLPNPETIDPKEREAFVNDFVSSAIQDAQMTEQDRQAEECDEAIDGLDLEVDQASVQKLKTVAGRFYDNNAGDLQAWRGAEKYHNLHGMYDVNGHDAYMTAARTGVGYNDRVATQDIEAKVLARRIEHSVETEMPSLEEGATLGDDGKLHFEEL